MKLFVFLGIVATCFTTLEANLGPCPEIHLPKWDDFDFLKTQTGIWYLTHMTNFEIGKDIDESVRCTDKVLEITNDYKSINYVSMGFPLLKNVTYFNLTANIEFNNKENKRNFTLNFLGEISWKIGPIYILEGDAKVYTLHWQCFILNNQRVENFLLYSRKETIEQTVVDEVKKKLSTFVPKGTGTLAPITRCAKP
uniref:Lipocalin/cytosolic fatty-acid binding domain-containing protein n=1 Tax=Strigamia maritima TaxID=126957 RepID=T1JC46_STRMM